MAKIKVQSVEPNIADLVNGWLKSYKLDYKLEQESLNTEIDQAFKGFFQKAVAKAVTDLMQSCYCVAVMVSTIPSLLNIRAIKISLLSLIVKKMLQTRIPKTNLTIRI